MICEYKIEIYDVMSERWLIHRRFYRGLKDLEDFDLCNIPNKRRNARLSSVYFK